MSGRLWLPVSVMRLQDREACGSVYLCLGFGADAVARAI